MGVYLQYSFCKWHTGIGLHETAVWRNVVQCCHWFSSRPSRRLCSFFDPFELYNISWVSYWYGLSHDILPFRLQFTFCSFQGFGLKSISFTSGFTLLSSSSWFETPFCLSSVLLLIVVSIADSWLRIELPSLTMKFATSGIAEAVLLKMS